MAYKNKEDQAAAARRHYENNRQAMIDRAAAHKAAKRIKVREFLQAKKDAPCIDCGIKYPHYVMDFDHVRGQKVCNLGDAITKGISMKRIQEEVDKCEVVCSNCHRIRTWERANPTPAPT